MNQRLLSFASIIDIKKALDAGEHGILIDKLNHCGFRGIINDWFSSYLNCRPETTQVRLHFLGVVFRKDQFLDHCFSWYMSMISTDAQINLGFTF